MDQLQRSLILTALIAFTPFSAFSEDVSASSSATINQPIQVLEERVMDFAILLPQQLSDQVEMVTGVGLTSANETTTFLGNWSWGHIRVYGVPGSIVDTSAESSVLSGPGADMVLDNINVRNDGAPLNSQGQKLFYVGARLSINANQAPGVYSGTYNVNVTYQ